jgi:hypothetical protein
VFRFGTRAFVVVPFGVVVVLFGVLRFVLAMVGVVAKVVIKVKKIINYTLTLIILCVLKALSTYTFNY